MSRTPIRDVTFNQPRCRLSTGETCRIVDRWSMAERENVARSKTSRGEGLVPRWGRGGASQNPPRQFAVPGHNSVFLFLGVPAPAGPAAPPGIPPFTWRFSAEELAIIWYHASKNKHARIERRRSTHLFLQNKLLHTRGWSRRNRKTCFCKTNSYAHEGGVGAIEKPVFAKQLASQALGQTTPL